MQNDHRKGFTIIELLVVVTIIVVLLALLVPAMDKAIYQAELASCGASVKGIGNGLGVYALSHNRHYPYRYYADGRAWWPQWLARPGSTDDDVRLLLQGIVSMKAYADPLCGDMDFDPASTAGSQVLGNFSIWGGFRYAGNKGMRKIGDRLEWGDDKFNLLVSDWDLRMENSGQEGSHPDANATMRLYITQNQTPTDTALTGDPALDGPVQGYWTLSRWFDASNRSPRRGLIDHNYGFQDGSVIRFNDMPADWEDDGEKRFTGLPLEGDATNFAVLKLQVPVR